MAELIIMTGGYLAPRPLGDINQLLRFLCIERERLLNVDVAPTLQAFARDFEMALRRSCYVNYVWARLGDQIVEVGIGCLDREAFAQLFCHEFFAIARSDHFTTRNTLNLSCMRIRDLPASDYRYFKHAVTSSDSSRRTSSDLPS